MLKQVLSPIMAAENSLIHQIINHIYNDYMMETHTHTHTLSDNREGIRVHIKHDKHKI